MPPETIGNVALGAGLTSVIAFIVWIIHIAVDRNSVKKDLQRMKIDKKIDDSRKQYELSATKRLESKIERINKKVNSIANADDLNELLPDASKSKSIEYSNPDEKTVNPDDE